MMKIQMLSVSTEELIIELDSAITLLNQLQINLKNYGSLTQNGWNIFNLMQQELKRTLGSVISD